MLLFVCLFWCVCFWFDLVSLLHDLSHLPQPARKKASKKLEAFSADGTSRMLEGGLKGASRGLDLEGGFKGASKRLEGA